MLQISIGLSIILGFITNEFFVILSGGMVSAGYLAFFIEEPYRILTTTILAIMTALIVKFLSKFIIIFGRRRFALSVIISLMISWFVNKNLFYFVNLDQDIRIIGYVIPGLIANDMIKQGIIKTLVIVYLLAIFIRLILLLGM